MNRREAAEEPSMEDILASIRKIIADEPAATSAASLPLPQLSPAGYPLPSKDLPNAATTPQPSLSARLNDVFGPGTIIPTGHDRSSPRQPLHASQPIQAAPHQAAPSRISAGRSIMDDDLGDLLADGPPAARKPDPAQPAADPIARRPATLDLSSSDAFSSRPASQPAAANTRLTELRPVQSHFDPVKPETTLSPAPQVQAVKSAPESSPKSEPVVIASMARSAPREAPQVAWPPMAPSAPALTATQATPEPATAPSTPTRPEPVVLASSKPFIFPAAPTPAAIAQSDQPIIIPANEPPLGISASTLDFLKPAPKPADPALVLTPQVSSTLSAEPAPVAAPSAPPVVIAAPPAPASPSQPAYEVIASPTMRAPAVANTLPPKSPAPPAPALNEAAPEPVAAPVAEDPVVEPIQAQAEPSGMNASDDAVASALGALAAGLAASAQQPEIIVSAVEITPPAEPALPSSSPPAPSPEPSAFAAVATQPTSVFSSTGSFVGGAALTPVSTSTLDDTAAELLRPMLRQWLDDNMPRIVERALRIELAETVDITPKSDPKP